MGIRRILATLLTTALVAAFGVATTAAPAQAACVRGAQQLNVERYLNVDKRFGRVIVDGCQSPTDKATVANFQRFNDMRLGASEWGIAGNKTHAITSRLAKTNYRACTSSATIVCVDLTAQTAYLVRGKVKVGGPYPIRSGVVWKNAPPGKKGGPTPTGLYRVITKKPSTPSVDFDNVPMKLWQGFGGCSSTSPTASCAVGLHQATTWLYDSRIPGSHGCVNLTPAAAQQVWNFTTRLQTYVYVYGRKPGT